MITAAPHHLNRRAFSAAQRWLEAPNVSERLRIAGWCALSDAECEALDQLRENLQALAGETDWFDNGRQRLRPDVAQRLIVGLTLDQRDFREFLRLLKYPVSNIHFTIVYRQWLKRDLEALLKPVWKSLDAAQAQDDRIRAEQREARERAQAAAEAAAELERQRVARLEWEQKQRERDQATQAQEKTMETATLNGNGKLIRPERLSPLEEDVWDALRARGMDPRVNVSTETKREIARRADSTEGSVSQALASIRNKMRREADEHLRGLPDTAPAETTVAEIDTTDASLEPVFEPQCECLGVVLGTCPHCGKEHGAVGASERSGSEEKVGVLAQQDDLPEGWDAEVRELRRQRNALGTQVEALKCELEQVTADRAKAWEELHELHKLKNAPDESVAIEPAPITPEMERQAKAMFPDLVRVQLTGDDKRLALDLAAGCDVSEGLTERNLDVRAEILRRAADAVEAVLA